MDHQQNCILGYFKGSEGITCANLNEVMAIASTRVIVTEFRLTWVLKRFKPFKSAGPGMVSLVELQDQQLCKNEHRPNAIVLSATLIQQ